MNPLDALRALMSRATASAERPFVPSGEIDLAIKRLESQVNAGVSRLPVDQQHKAVKEFWETGRVHSFKDARLVSFGLCLRATPAGTCVLEDSRRFATLLSAVDQYAGNPRRYRRCYQGLLTNYFEYDPNTSADAAAGKNQWLTLREYLKERVSKVADVVHNPSWVSTTLEHQQLFSDAPCDRYAPQVLRGDTEEVDNLRRELGIGDASWFIRELLLAQVAIATRQSDSEFVGRVPQLLALITKNAVLRDKGLALILDRYAAIRNASLHVELRNVAIACWGNPWLNSNQMRWGTVTADARALVTDWLKLEFIETFFTLLTEQGSGDTRRLEFWKRYVHVIEDIHFALGSDARMSREPDLVALRKKMAGLTTQLADSIGATNAFIMTVGSMVMVEFSGAGNALYIYDRRDGLPFDVAVPLAIATGARNSLKNQDLALRWRHADGVRGWSRWEDMFEADLRESYGIVAAGSVRARDRRSTTPATPRSSSTTGHHGARSSGAAGPVPFSRAALLGYTRSQGLRVVDNSDRGGNIWVIEPLWNPTTSAVLSSWGFTFKRDKGWWR